MTAIGFGMSMIIVAVGWQVYELHHDPLDLGLVGLAEFIPLPLLALPAGQLADRVSRRLIFAVSILIDFSVACGLLAVTVSGGAQLWHYMALAAGTGISSAIGSPASRALPPALVPGDLLASALALRSTGV